MNTKRTIVQLLVGLFSIGILLAFIEGIDAGLNGLSGRFLGLFALGFCALFFKVEITGIK